MAAYKTFVKENDSQNWLKSTLALRITRDGLLDLAEYVIFRTQQQILLQILSARHLTIGTTCDSCTTPNIVQCPTRGRFVNCKTKMYRPCPMNICDTFRDKICDLHRLYRPSWRNTRAELWCRNHFEVAKFFMGGGFHNATSFVDVDLNGVLSLMLNCTAYASYFSFPMTHQNILTEIRDIWRSVRHSPDLKVSDGLFEMCMVKCKALLEDSNWLSTNPAAKAAVEKLNKLMTDEMPELEQEESKFALAQAAEIVSEVQDLIDVTLGGETKRPMFSNEAEKTGITLKYIQTNLKRIQKVMKKVTGDDIHRGATSTDSGYGTCSMKSSVYADSEDDVLSFVSDVNFTEEQSEIFQLKIEQWQTADIDFKDTGTMTELMNKDVATMTEHRDDTSLADSMKSDLSGACVNTDTATMTELVKKDEGTMAEHRDATSLADYLESDLLKFSVNVETGAMTEFMKKDVGTMTQYRDYTSQADSMTTDLSKPSADFAMADFHICTVEEALAKEPDSIINLAVQVIKTEASQSYTNNDKIMRSYFPCLVADKTGSVWLRVYQEHERNTFKSHTSIMLRGLLRKSCEHPMWCVSTTELIYLKPVDVPQKIIEAAMKTTQPMSPQIRFLDEAVTSQSPSIAVDKLLPRDAIHEVTDPIPDSPDPDLLADVDGSEDICNTIQIDHTSPADSLETVLSEPSVNFDIEARTIPDLMKKCIGTITENRDQLDDQNETDEPLAAINETLYTQTQLNELCSQDGRKSKTVSRACDVIVNHLKETFDNMLCSNNEVLDIYPAFKVGKENEIIFVVTLSKTTDISVLCNAVTYSLEIRVLHKFNNELKTLMDAVHEESHSISDECQRPIAVTIGNWAKPLLEAHKYLSVITASPLKSKRNKDSEILQSFVREPECCIVFCVHAKDFICIKEDPLPAKLNGISTDVMEGAFVTFGRLSHESHDKLPMGCEIGRGESRDIGTLGGFIDHPEYGLCGITSGHMCLDHAEYEACVKNNGRLMLEQWPKGSRGRGMFQPAKLQNGDEVGQLVEALYQVGGHLESGFDVALFQIENKYPEDGNFPAEKINDNMRDVGYTFKGGNVCGLSRAAGKSLWKFGRTSGSTTGKANLKTPTAVQEASFNWKTHDKYHITLVNQFEVSPIDIGQNKIFANHGDSGALVFIDEDRDDLKCVGMVAGGLVGTSIAIISPISSILKHCNVTKFHSFYNTPRQNSEAIQSLERRLGERIETIHSQLDQRITRIDDNFKRLFIMLEQQSNCASNTSSHEKRPSTQEINKSSKK